MTTSSVVPLASIVGTTPHQGKAWEIAGLAFSGTCSHMAEWFVSRNRSGSLLRVVDLDSGLVLAEHELTFVPRMLQFSPSGERILVVPGNAGDWRGLTVVVDGHQHLDRPLDHSHDVAAAMSLSPGWGEQAELLAACWLDDDLVQLAGRAHGHPWIARLSGTGRFNLVWSRPFDDAGRVEDWADCAPTGRVVFGVRWENDEHPEGFRVIDAPRGRTPSVRSGYSWRWLIPRPASLHLSDDGRQLAFSSSRSVGPHILLFDQHREVQCPDHDYLGPRRAAKDVAAIDGLVVASGGGAFWTYQDTDRGYRMCGSLGGLESTVRLRSVVRRDGRTLLATTVNGDDCSSVYELADSAALLLGSDDRDDRMWAVQRLASQPDPGAVSALSVIARGEDGPLALAAVRALGASGTTLAVGELVRVAGDTDDGKRRQLAVDLALAAEPEVLASTVLRLMNEDDAAARRGVARAAGRLAAGELHGQLQILLKDRDATVREAAADALGERADVRGVLSLLARFADPAPEVRDAVGRALAAVLHVGAEGQDGARITGVLADEAQKIIEVGRVDDPAATQSGHIASVVAAVDHAEHPPIDVVNGLEAVARAGAAGRCIALAVGARLAVAWLGSVPARMEDASGLAAQAVRFADAAGAHGLRWRLRALRGDCAAAAAMLSVPPDPARLRAAADHYAAAMKVIDTMWYALLDEDMLRGFFADKASLYDDAMRCALLLGHPSAALEILEKSKTRYLGDLIARRHTDPVRRLEPTSQIFWRFARTGEQVRADAERFVSGLSPAGRSPSGEMMEWLPRRLAALARASHDQQRSTSNSDRSELSWAVHMVAQVWRYLAHAQTWSHEGSDYQTEVRRYLDRVHQVLVDLRQLTGSPDPGAVGSKLSEYADAVRPPFPDPPVLHDISDQRPWALNEYRESLDTVVRGADPQAVLVVDALAEVTGYYADGPVAVVEWHGPVGNSNGPAMPVLATAALRSFRQTHWQEVARIVRGEVVGVAEAIAILAGHPDTALLQFALTAQGTVVFLAAGTPARADAVPEHPLDTYVCASVTTARLQERLVGWLRHYQRSIRPPHSEQATADWRDAADELAGWLYEQLFRPILPWLKSRGIRRLFVVPHRGLHLVPLGAWHPPGQDEYVSDDFEVFQAPSLTIYDICRRRQPSSTIDDHVITVNGPARNLPLAGIEASLLVAALRPGAHTQLTGSTADRSNWSAVSTQATHTHYSGHARYVWDDPLASHLQLASSPLTLGDLFDDAIPLRDSWLVALSACETTMTDPGDSADEYLGIASGFVFGGTPAVLSTLWAVQDAAALLLTSRFYQELAAGNRPSRALARAQRWLRRARHGNVITLLRHALVAGADHRPDIEVVLDYHVRQRRTHPLARPFGHPTVWAAFTLAGVDDGHARRR